MDIKAVKESMVEPVIKQLNPFIKSMSMKFDKCFDVPDCVPLMDQSTQQNATPGTVNEIKNQFNELVKTYMRVRRFFSSN